jgi:hypothetical protein
MKILAWYTNPNGVENKYILKYSHPFDVKKRSKNLIAHTRMVLEKE